MSKRKSLSRAELQLLQSILTQELRLLEEDKQMQCNLINDCWAHSNPDTDTGKEYFIALNAHKDLLRTLKRRHANIAKVQHSIKRALG